jgi:hypothetical protein
MNHIITRQDDIQYVVFNELDRSESATSVEARASFPFCDFLNIAIFSQGGRLVWLGFRLGQLVRLFPVMI